MKWFSSWLLITCLWCVAGASADEMERLESLRLVDHPANDGDSFHVTDGVAQWNLRLYFVDCPESDVDSGPMARRVREQTRYFGLDDYADTVRYGDKATEQVQEWLAEPFTAYTVHARAMGRSAMPRVYAFVVTADGRDLDKLLVQAGLARSHGVGRRDYEGTSRDERQALLADLEAEAMLERRGVWAASNPARIAELRAAERMESRALAAVRAEAGFGGMRPDDTLDLNTASREELQRLPGIGPVLARRIEARRPFRSVDELAEVSGISDAAVERLRPFVAIDPP